MAPGLNIGWGGVDLKLGVKGNCLDSLNIKKQQQHNTQTVLKALFNFDISIRHFEPAAPIDPSHCSQYVLLIVYN